MLQLSFSGIEMTGWEIEQLEHALTPVIEKLGSDGKARFSVSPVGHQFETMLKVKTPVGSLTAYALAASPLASTIKAVQKVSDLVTSLGVISTRGGSYAASYDNQVRVG